MEDYSSIGLKVGLEIHRQLDTKRKLFCDCPTEGTEDGESIIFIRKLREVQSELGTVDAAAVFESRKRKTIVYHANPKNVCLVEMDEEPPHSLNPEALEVALIVALLLDSKPVDEVHVMRKIVIDGSNTTGFQRTCIIGIGGQVRVKNKTIPIQTITLEEDAARIIEVGKDEVHYDLSRLGIPLIEVSTEPVIESPGEAVEVAYAIGRILRATGKVKRGIGTVRQDLNISIKGGVPVEIKGVQELELIQKVVENEVKRQLHLLRIREELLKRNVKKEDIWNTNPVEVTHIFSKTSSKIIKRQLEAGGVVYALKLRGFAGLLGLQPSPGIRLGAEIAGRVRAWSEVEGIFHTDELPNYGITVEEVKALRDAVGAGELDAVIIVAAERDKALYAMDVVKERAAEALDGVPEETRAARPDGTTFYMRPRPGSARMYPETDIPPIIISQEYIEHLKARLPPTLDVIAQQLMEKYGLSKQLANDLIDHDTVEDFEEIVSKTGALPTVVASTLTELLRSLRREGINVEKITKTHMMRFFELVSCGKVAKEAAKDVLTAVAQKEQDVDKAIDELGLWSPSISEVEDRIRALVKEHRQEIFTDERRATAKLMGELMKDYRGRVDGALLNSMLLKAIQALKSEGSNR
ncbi:MAG: Glu-tRNA(Gln) amidotransferase subunit GatE [Nitrososphaerota archaeon]|nr:Glu-tRNA(Gln) amidotransferase subunit GatE [Aigarchaeota archaeon]MDW8076523.1 Glu-tRNA(Gln) amidotransferase subunit GatE [Nitrososphaerota archaeon]